MHNSSSRYFYTELLQQDMNQIKEPEERCYHIKIDDEIKRHVNPFKLRSCLSDKSNQKVQEVATDTQNRLFFKVKKNEELN